MVHLRSSDARIIPPPTESDLPPGARSEAAARLMERIAWLMDRAVTIPGTRVSFGLDALLGLVPVGGEAVTGVVQIGLVLMALHQYRVPKAVAVRMIANVLLDTGLGSIPILGDIFDVFFKANTKNLALLKQVQEHQKKGEPVPAAPSIGYLLLVGGLLGGAIVLALVGTVALISWLI